MKSPLPLPHIIHIIIVASHTDTMLITSKENISLEGGKEAQGKCIKKKREREATYTYAAALLRSRENVPISPTYFPSANSVTAVLTTAVRGADIYSSAMNTGEK